MREEMLLKFICLSVAHIALSSFTVVPYARVDLQHYLQLAICQAKCTSEFGTIISKKYNDGKSFDSGANTNEDLQFCVYGCELKTIEWAETNISLRNAYDKGVHFLIDNDTLPNVMESNGRQAVKSLRVGCMDVGYSINDGYEDSVEGILLIELFSEVRVPLRYVLQWKQRTFALGFYDESPWITSSVEVEQAVAVQGMIPGVQYCFMVTAVDADGIFGIPVVSDWVEALDVDASPRLPCKRILNFLI
ncbi:unnamed protein product [Toxocara canis]|uniref:Fibronectin type-III domain-containing protein n=1 Tax=Toxocara canis TaxID=6265 RepID=A0A183VAX2_TOXCA|nr:unnamed protein product [Toxocara canis]